MMEKVRQKVIKVYPATYTGGKKNLDELNEFLSDGWLVKQTVLSVEDKSGSKIYDYILEKNMNDGNT